MGRTVWVDTGMVEVARGKVLLKSTPLGSCIAIMGYSRETQQGGMAHIMLPGRAPTNVHPKTKYAADAIDVLLERLSNPYGYAGLRIFLVGAGNVLMRSRDTICQDNISSVTDYLNRFGLLVRGFALGGIQRRVAHLDVETGHVSYTEGNLPLRTLYHSCRQHSVENFSHLQPGSEDYDITTDEFVVR